MSTTPNPGKNDDPEMLNHLGYRGIFWLTIGSIVVPIYLVACILSVIKAYSDRKQIKARIMAKRLNQPAPQSPLDIIAKEVRENKWHKRQSSMTVAKVQSLLRANTSTNSYTNEGVRFKNPSKEATTAQSGVGDTK